VIHVVAFYSELNFNFTPEQSEQDSTRGNKTTNTMRHCEHRMILTDWKQKKTDD